MTKTHINNTEDDGEEQQKDRSANKEWQNCNKQQQGHRKGTLETP
jgi:hypothetical protein